MKNKIGSIINYFVAFCYVVIGIIYLIKDSFMPYHQKAVSLQWSQIDLNIQFLILALMRAVSAGFILMGLIIIWLQMEFFRTKLRWISSLILISVTVFSLIQIYATMIVRLNTPGNPPTTLILAGLLLIVIGFVFNRKSLSDISSSQ
jgi:hypothetical protein